MSIELEIGIYKESDENSGDLTKNVFSSIDEAISYIEFLKLQYDSFGKTGSLVVRLEKGSKPYLLDYNSVVPIKELRKELEEKYNIQNAETDEIEFKFTDKSKKENLNSNFSFSVDEKTKYAQTSTGEKLPFKLFTTDDTGVGSNLLRETQNSGENSDFALIERRFSQNNSLQFFGSEKIESLDDVAWLFKSLEDEAVEHAFLVYDFEDKGYFVQHISSGSFSAALIDNRAIVGNVLESNPKSITLVHNHPSGNLKASAADAHVLGKLKKALLHTDVAVNDGIIINLRSGKYLVFNENLIEEIKNREGHPTSLNQIQPYSFSKQVLVQNYQPIQVSSADQVAAYITSQKFGISDKTELLILNNQLSIVGKFIIPVNNQEHFITEKVSKYGGSNCILFGNNITPELVDYYSSRLEFSNITITDAILFKSENGKKMWESFVNEDKIRINHNASTDSLSDNYKSNYNHMEKNQLTWADRVVTPQTNAYKDFIKEMKSKTPDEFLMKGEREFTDKEKKFMQIYSNKGENMIEGSNFSLRTIYNNLPDFLFKENFNSTLVLLNFIKEHEISDKKHFIIQNNIDFSETSVKNEADRHKLLSDVWAKELQNKTDLSYGLNNTQIDEKQAYHYNLSKLKSPNYELEKKASELVKLLNTGNILVISSKTQFTNVSVEVDKLDDLVNYLQNKKISDGHSLEVRPFASNDAYIMTNQQQNIDLQSELKFIKQELENSSELNNKSDVNIFDDSLEKKQDFIKEEKEVVGKLTFLDSGEVMNYKSSESYLNALKSEFDSNMGGFTYETVIKTPELLKNVDDLLYNVYGEINPKSLSSYQNHEFSINPDSNPLTSFESDSNFIDDLFDDIENGVGDLWEKENKNKEIVGGKIKDIAQATINDPYYIKNFDVPTQNLVNQYIYHSTNAFPIDIDKMELLISEIINDSDPKKLEKFRDAFINDAELDYFQTKAQTILHNSIEKIQNRPLSLSEIEVMSEKINNVFKILNNQKNPKIMEAKNDFNQNQYLQNQLKYLGFGESEILHKDLESAINSTDKNFEIKTSSDKALPGNTVDFNLKFSKSEQGGIFLNSYDATLSNSKSEVISQNFRVSKENSFTAKEAVNLLEGRAVKIEFTNPKTDQKEQAFVKLNFSAEKNKYGNYDFQTFSQNYGVDTKQIIEKSNLIFDKPEFKESTIKSLEKGNVVKVKFELNDQTIDGKAVLNPQYKTLNLYDSDMNRINTNKPLQGIDSDNKHEKSNVREQSMSRGI